MEIESLKDKGSESPRGPDTFSEIRKRRKRPKVTDMDTEDVEGESVALTEEREAPAKRPLFPPVDASTVVVRKYLSSTVVFITFCNVKINYTVC